MPNSDPNSDNDLLVREVVRQIADAAPPPPEWERMVRAGSKQESRSEVPWAQFALVAAITAIVVSGLWLIARPDGAPEVPADVPVTVTLAPVRAPSSWAEWAAATDRFDVQLCHSRAVARITSESGLMAFAGRAGDPGYTPERARHAAFRAPVAGFTGLEGHPGTDPSDVVAIGPMVAAWHTAESGYFGAGGDEPSASFADDAAEAERQIDLYVESATDPGACWFEQAAGAPTVAVAPGGEREMIACLLSAQLDVAVSDSGTSAEDADDELVGFIHAAWSDYADATTVPLADLAASLEALAEAPPGDRHARADDVHELLEPVVASTDAPCAGALSTPPSIQ